MTSHLTAHLKVAGQAIVTQLQLAAVSEQLRVKTYKVGGQAWGGMGDGARQAAGLGWAGGSPTHTRTRRPGRL